MSRSVLGIIAMKTGVIHSFFPKLMTAVVVCMDGWWMGLLSTGTCPVAEFIAGGVNLIPEC